MSMMHGSLSKQEGWRDPCKTVEGRGPNVTIKWSMSYPLREETSGRISTCKFGPGRTRLLSYPPRDCEWTLDAIVELR